MGDKFGKSAGNAMWLSSKKTSAFTLYQFFIRQTDSEVEKFLKLFTFDSLGAIKDLMRRHKEKPDLRIPQKHLAEQIVLLVHGEKGLQAAQRATKVLYEGNVAVLGEMHTHEVSGVFEGSTVVNILPEQGMSLLGLAMKARCFPTKGKIKCFL